MAALDPVEGYEQIICRNAEHRERLERISESNVFMTRFYDPVDTADLGITDMMATIFNGTRTQGLLGMSELTYDELSKEFLSSFRYRKTRTSRQVFFRLMNETFEPSLAVFGEWLGLGTGGSEKSPRVDLGITWSSITSAAYPGGQSKFLANRVHHPAIRLWFGVIGRTIFGRPEPNNLTMVELDMLSSFLNVDCGEPYTIDVAHHVAKYLMKVGNGRLSAIHCGGIATALARQLLPAFNPAGLTVACDDPDEYANEMSISLAYMSSSLKWIVPHPDDDGTWYWRLGDRNTVLLPDDVHELVQLRQEARNPANTRFRSYRLQFLGPVGDDFFDQEDENAEAEEENEPAHEAPQQGYQPQQPDQYQYQPQYQANYLQQQQFNQQYPNYQQQQQQYQQQHIPYPPNFQPYPPLVAPHDWSMNSIGTYLVQMGNQATQGYNDHNLTLYPIHEDNIRSGLVGPNYRHPSYYIPGGVNPPNAPSMGGTEHGESSHGVRGGRRGGGRRGRGRRGGDGDDES